MQALGRISNACRHELSSRRVENQLHQRGRVEDDHRALRSARITSAAQPFKDLVARGTLQRLPYFTQDVVGHRHALHRRPRFQATVEFRRNVPNLDHRGRHDTMILSSLFHVHAGGPAVPAIVPATWRNHASRANGSQVARSGKSLRWLDLLGKSTMSE